MTGFLWAAGSDTVCVSSCIGKGYESYYLAEKTCVTNCITLDTSGALHSIPLAGSNASLHLKCVIDCWAVDK